MTNIKNNTIEPVPHKNTVKYLGVYLDNLLRLNKHIDAQLDKTNKAFHSNCRIFYNK